MHIIVQFQFNHEPAPLAFTGVEGDVVDMLLPSVGDLVRHFDTAGAPFEGKVTDRTFSYDLPGGVAIQGTISVTLWLDRNTVQ